MKKTLIAMAVAALCLSCGRGKEDFDASGRFEATETVVSAEVAGRLTCLEVTEGQQVTEGERVGAIDTVQTILKISQLEAMMSAAASRRTDISRQVAATEQLIATQRRERERFRKLVEADAANQKQLDDIDAQIALLEKQLSAQRSTLESGNRSLGDEARSLFFQIEQMRDMLAKSRITSPVGGTVTAKYAETGEMAAVGRPLFKVADLENIYLRAYVAAAQLTQVKLGQKADVYADFGPGDYRVYPGTVTWISDRAEFTPKSIQTRDERADQVYAVKIAVRGDGYLKTGMYGQVKFVREEE